MEALQNSHEVNVPKSDMNEVGYYLPSRLFRVYVARNRSESSLKNFQRLCQ